MKNGLLLSLIGSLLIFILACEDSGIAHHDEPEIQYGIVKDFSQFDGCGLVIELDDGTILVPYQLDTTMMLSDGQTVNVAFTELNNVDYKCNAGILVELSYLEPIGCVPIIPIESKMLSSTLPSDPFTIEDADIEDHCLKLSVTYGGGCKIHEFIMIYTPALNFCDYGGKLTLSHNAHGDMCEALVTDTLSFDLISVQEDGANAIRLVLEKEGDVTDYQLIIDYYY